MMSNEHLIVIGIVFVFFLVLVFNEHLVYWIIRKFSRTQKEKGEEGDGNKFRCYHFLPRILNQGSQSTTERADAVMSINTTIRNVLMSSGWMTPSNAWHGLLETDKNVHVWSCTIFQVEHTVLTWTLLPSGIVRMEVNSFTPQKIVARLLDELQFKQG